MAESKNYERIPFEDSSLPVRLNTVRIIRPGTVVFREERCRWHEQIELLIPREGKMLVAVAGKTVGARSGELILVNPYERHLVLSGEVAARFDCLMIDSSLYREGAQGLSSAGWIDLLSGGYIRFENRIAGDPEPVFHADAVCRELSSREPAYDLSVRAHVSALLVALFRAHLSGIASAGQIAENAALYDRIKPAVALIRQDLSVRRSREELAAACHLSPAHFSRQFRRIIGCSPVRFDAELRLREAAALLKNRALSIEQIAQNVGFDDPGYFSRCFKNHFGMTPTRARDTAGK